MINNKYKKNDGPWSNALDKPITDLPITITIYDKDDNIIHEEHIQYSYRQDRLWLGKITAWACQNGYYVESKGR